MADDQVILASRVDIDNVVFSACTEVAEKLPGMSVRDKTKFAIAAADRIMEGVDELGGKAKRSEAGRVAAAARHNKTKPAPTPGPAIPPPAPDPSVTAAATSAGLLPPTPQPPPNMVIPPPLPTSIAPPPHPALAPNPATMPFGAPPA